MDSDEDLRTIPGSSGIKGFYSSAFTSQMLLRSHLEAKDFFKQQNNRTANDLTAVFRITNYIVVVPTGSCHGMDDGFFSEEDAAGSRWKGPELPGAKQDSAVTPSRESDSQRYKATTYIIH